MASEQESARQATLDAVAAGSVQRIVAIRCSRLGDLLFVTPALRLLRRRFPDAHLTMVTTPATAAVLDVPGLVDEVVTADLKSPWRRLASQWRVPLPPPRALRGLRADLAIPFSRRKDHQELARQLRPRHLWSFDCCGKAQDIPLPDEIHLAVEGRPVDPALVPPQRPLEQRLRHSLSWHVSLIDPLLGPDRPAVPAMEIACTDQDRQSVGARLQQHGLPAARPLVWVHPGFHGSQRARNLDDAGKRAWPEAHWRKLCGLLVEHGLSVALTSGSEMERRACESIAGESGAACTVLPGLSCRELAALGERAAAFVGLDSGPMHVAAAVGAPIVALFGPTRVSVTGPYVPDASQVRILRLPLPCSPCRGAGAKCVVNQCLKLIEAPEVFEHVREVLREPAQLRTA